MSGAHSVDRPASYSVSETILPLSLRSLRSIWGGEGKKLRKGFTFQYLEVPNDRERALLEHRATAWHCPAHLGVGSRRYK
jgi:hypothetical protein